MTGRELFLRMLMLGDRTGWNAEVEESAKYEAANMAIDEVNALLPVTEVARILHFPTRPVLAYPGITVHKGGEDTVYNASGVRSLAFAISGTGDASLYRVVDGEPCERLTLRFDDSEYGELIEGWNDFFDFRILRYVGTQPCDVCLTFTGELNYLIKDISFYDAASSEFCEEVTPYSREIAYDLNSQKYACGRFLDFASVPLRCDGEDVHVISDYKIEGSVIYLPTDTPAAVEITYKRKPSPITPDTLDTELDVDASLAPLVVLKAAYYIYMLIDPEAAEKCLVEYARQMNVILSKTRKVRTPRKMINLRKGW